MTVMTKKLTMCLYSYRIEVFDDRNFALAQFARTDVRYFIGEIAQLGAKLQGILLPLAHDVHERILCNRDI